MINKNKEKYKNWPWYSFLLPADEWIVNYFLPSYSNNYVPFTIKLFSIGHALELYLKAVYAKQTEDIAGAISYSHNLISLWDDIKKNDPSFLSNYQLKSEILAIDFLDYRERTKLCEQDRDNYRENFELYFIVKFLPDIKYLGAPTRILSGAGYYMIFPNEYWIRIFKEIRKYLHWPLPNVKDEIDWVIKDEEAPLFTKHFLRQFYY